VCRSMTDIQSATAEIRRGKKIEEEEDRRNHRAEYNGQPITIGGHSKLGRGRLTMFGLTGGAYSFTTGTESVLSVTLVYHGQTVGWIRMPLGMDVGLDPGHTVLDGDPPPPTLERGIAPTFRPMSIVAKRSPISATAELLLDHSTLNFGCFADNRKQDIMPSQFRPSVRPSVFHTAVVVHE